MVEPGVQQRPLPSPTNRASGLFVGRQREINTLRVALENVLSGHGRLVALAGEPGIGKTRTTQELANQAEALGVQVLWGWCYEGHGAPPFWPWAQAIRSYLQSKGDEHLKSEIGPGAADIAQIVPEVKERVPGLPPPALEPDQARFRLFDSIATFLKNAAQTQPLLLVLDDLHCADRPSLSLLEFAAREFGSSRLLVIATYRDTEVSRGHPLAQTLGGLARHSSFQRIVLRGLSQDEVRHFVQASSGIQPTSGFVEAVHSQTEGNPFFLTEVVKLLEQEGELSAARIGGQGGWALRIPQGVRDVIGRRLDRLSSECNQVLSIASVIGSEFGVAQLRQLTDDLAEDQLLGVLEEALESRVIKEVPHAIDRYQFVHSLIQETLISELSVARRVRLHARIGYALEELYAADLAAHATELAHHFSEAESVTGTEKLVHYSLLAGENTLATYAHEEALAHFQRGLAAKEGQPADVETAALLFGLGLAQAATLQRQEALATLGRAFDYYYEAGDVSRVVDLSERLPLIPGVGGVLQFISRALELVPADSHQAGRLLSRYGLCLNYEMEDYQRAQEAFRRALAIAQRESDAALEMRILANTAAVDAVNLNWQESLETSLRAIELARQADYPYAEARGQLWAATGLYITGDHIERIRLHTKASLAVAERLRDRTFMVSALWINATLAGNKGDWQATRDFSDRALAISPRDPRLLCTRALAEYQAGEFGQGRVYLDWLAEAMQETTPRQTFEYGFPMQVIPMIAIITGTADYCALAEKAAVAILSLPSATPLMMHYHTRPAMALLAVQRRDSAAATEEYAALKSVPAPPNMYYFTGRDRLLGLLCVTTGQLDQAIAHFEDAYALSRSSAYPVECGWVAYERADTLLRRKGPGDQVMAHSLLEESLIIAQELGMRPLLERAANLQSRAELQPRRGDRPVAPTYPDGLTQREVEVLRLLASGKSNREIAEELFISVRTAGNHVRNILVKTGTSNRTGAATYATRNGLV